MNGSAIHVCELKVVEISRFLRCTYPLFWKEISVDTVIDTVEAIKSESFRPRSRISWFPAGMLSCATVIGKGEPWQTANSRPVYD